MTDPGWDIPGVPREPSAGTDAPASAAAAWPADASSPRRNKSGRKQRGGSVSASSGLSAGAFAPLRVASAPPTHPPANAPGSATGSSPATVRTAAAAPVDSASPGGSEPGVREADIEMAACDSGSIASRVTGSPAKAAAAPGADSVRSACGASAEAAATDVGAGWPGARVTDPAQALAGRMRCMRREEPRARRFSHTPGGFQ